jgi:hypothetical protein
LITPKGFLWSGEDNTSPQIKKVTGKNVDDYQAIYEAIATVLVGGSVAFFSSGNNYPTSCIATIKKC